MKYTLTACTWEITKACNLHCRHCGSSCGEALADELTHDEAMAVVADLITLRPQRVALLGGEVFLREDWHIIAQKLAENGIEVNIVTNGGVIDDDVIEKLKAGHVRTIGVSLEGTEAVNNTIRGSQSYAGAINAIRRLKAPDSPCLVNVLTTLVKENLDDLPALRDELVTLGITTWQFQACIQEGYMRTSGLHPLEASDIMKIIDFAYDEIQHQRMRVVLADNLGYYTRKELIVRRYSAGTDTFPVWKGCGAGIRTVGIFHNGDVTGCASIRDLSFIEDNVRNRPLTAIWNDPDAFAWRRRMTGADIQGVCAECRYRDQCLSGCTALRFAAEGKLLEGNHFCAYYDSCLKQCAMNNVQ